MIRFTPEVGAGAGSAFPRQLWGGWAAHWHKIGVRSVRQKGVASCVCWLCQLWGRYKRTNWFLCDCVHHDPGDSCCPSVPGVPSVHDAWWERSILTTGCSCSLEILAGPCCGGRSSRIYLPHFQELTIDCLRNSRCCQHRLSGTPVCSDQLPGQCVWESRRSPGPEHREALHLSVCALGNVTTTSHRTGTTCPSSTACRGAH